MARAKRYGSRVPRLFTPPLRNLEPRSPETERWTFGYSVIDFARDFLLMTLLPWQEWLLIHGLELVEDETGLLRFRFRTVVVLIARQNGKSTLSKVLALWALYVLGVNMVLTAAQDLDTAQEIWQDAVDLVTEEDEDEGFVRPALAGMVEKVVRVNGSKALVLKGGSKYKVKAATRKAGRGLTGDLVILDELREHQNWAAWSALTKTTMARADAQVWTFSNAGDVSSVVLRYLRMLAHEALGDPDGIVAADKAAAPTDMDAEEATEDVDDDAEDVSVEDLEVDADDLFLAEWSAVPGCDRMDREQWPWANPSLGYLIEERTIAGSARTDPEWVMRTEVLCQWPDGTLEGLWPVGVWESTLNTVIEGPGGIVSLAPEDRIVGDAVMCVDMAFDRSRTYIVACGAREDGQPQVEVVAVQRGEAWVKAWLMERKDRIECVTGQAAGAPVSDLVASLAADRKFTVPVVPWGGPDLAGWTGRAFDAIKEGRLRHNPQPVLDQAAAFAVKKILGTRWVLDHRQSQADVAPLHAVFGAYGCWSRPSVAAPPAPPPPMALEAEGSVLSGAPGVMDIHF